VIVLRERRGLARKMEGPKRRSKKDEKSGRGRYP